MNDREALVRTRAATMTDLRAVVSWIGTPQECERWAGPGISYPLKPQALAEQIGMPSAIHVAVEDAHGLAAFGQALPRAPGRVHLARLIVRPDARGRGLGRTLAVALLTRAAATGATLATLNVDRDNAAALSLYTGLGFRRAERPQGAPASPAAVFMQRGIEGGPAGHRAVQAAAKVTLAALASSITPADTERSIAARAAGLLEAEGVYETWYYDCPALVLLGSRSCASVSGRDYAPSDEAVGEVNLVTVDLSPRAGDALGDCARSFCVEGGRVVAQPGRPEFRLGLSVVASLHRHLRDSASPDMTFGDLFECAAALLVAAGFENLDLRGNFGHTLTARLDKRSFIEAGSTLHLGDAAPFTFEPHVRRRNGRFGFKHEDVYWFDADGKATAL